MRDHKIALFEAREADLSAELAEKDAQVEELEVDSSPGLVSKTLLNLLQAALDLANTSLAHQRAAQSKTSQLLASTKDELASNSSSHKQLSRAATQLDEARAEITSLESKVETLEAKVRGLKEREKEARVELDGWLREEKGKEGSVSAVHLHHVLADARMMVEQVDKEKRELQTSLRSAKVELQKKSDELVDVQEELATLKETSKEREKVLKAKYRAANDERERLAGMEVRGFS